MCVLDTGVLHARVHSSELRSFSSSMGATIACIWMILPIKCVGYDEGILNWPEYYLWTNGQINQQKKGLNAHKILKIGLMFN